MLALFAILKVKMSQKQNVTVMDQKRRFNKRTVLTVIILVVTLVVIGVGVWLWAVHSSDKKKSGEGEIPKLSGQALTDAVNQKYAKGDYAGAAKLVEAQDASRTDPQTELLLASSYANAQNYKAALDLYADLDKKDSLSGQDTATAGEIAERAKEYQLAITYYQKAIDRVKADPEASANADLVPMYEAKISELKK